MSDSWIGKLRKPGSVYEALKMAVEELEEHQREYEYSTHPELLANLRHILETTDPHE